VNGAAANLDSAAEGKACSRSTSVRVRHGGRVQAANFRPYSKRFVTLLLFLAATLASAPALAAAASADPPAPVHYTVSLAHPEQHLVHVTLGLPPGAPERNLQLPVWNALYQVRDFSQYVNWVHATNPNGQKLEIQLLDKSRWRIKETENGATVEYEIGAANPGPFGAELNAQHAFFNLAEILMYPVDERSSPTVVDFTDVPSGWRVATTLAAPSADEVQAGNYDLLVDGPVEIGTFREGDFDQGGGHYRVVVDANPADYDMAKIVSVLQRIVAAATSWMNDRPFNTYLFLYHFPRGPGGGGMEHAYGTAIDIPVRMMADNPESFADVSAHEFFHLWNVKRIRPQSLEPVDYTKENYTRALWFSEGVTETVKNYTLLRAGLLDASSYFRRLGGEISELESRPAHLTQSAEESSLDAWLEEYPAYLLPARSISYYSKGDLLGTLLDLAVRDASHGTASLRDVFRWMNQNYAQKGRFFPDSEGVLQAADAVSHADLSWFFTRYVAGTDEIPWDDFFKSVGLQVVRYRTITPDLGFFATRNFDEPPIISRVDPNSEAAKAGLAAGDVILGINGRVTSSDFRQQLADLQPGDTLRLEVRGGQGQRQLAWKVGSRERVEFDLRDVGNLTAEQRSRRAAWLSGEDQPAEALP
jgi:predicted metalloprotease with PDZ domain